MNCLPLDGLRVVDFGLLLPGPYASRLLADLGAEVICIHPPNGDPGYEILPGLAPYLHHGKRAIRIDLKHAEGRQLAQDVAETADVVIEGFRPGVADRLGIGYEDLAALRPGIIYCSISGYGHSGPKRDLPAHDANVEASGGAFAGVMAVGGTPDTPYLPVADLASSMFAALSIVAAVVGRSADEEAVQSVHLDVSMEEALLHFAIPRWGRFLVDGHTPAAADLIAYSAGAGIFPTADGRHVAVAAIEDPFWVALCQSLGLPELADPPYDTHAGREADREVLRGFVAGAIREMASELLIDDLSRAGVPITLARTAPEVATDGHLLSRGALQPGPDGLHVTYPVQWSTRRIGMLDPDPAPDGGQSSLLAEIGCTPERTDRLIATGVVGGGGVGL